jgi:2-polyprenyl-3-methyl-5-hydroxy-6-metoxy-1,4-benzoquinol methylase
MNLEMQENIRQNHVQWDNRQSWETMYNKGFAWGDETFMKGILEKYFYPHKPVFKNVFEIAVGYGRLTEQIIDKAKLYIGIDLAQCCVDFCNSKFAGKGIFYTTDGVTIPVENVKFDLIISWDSMVHMDKEIIKNYLKNMKGLLSEDGTCFLHHFSGTGNAATGWRSNMTKEFMIAYCKELGYKIEQIYDLNLNPAYTDCITLLKHEV